MQKGKADILMRQPGPKPGSTKAIPQRTAIGEGFEGSQGPRRTMTMQKNGKTGGVLAPGVTTKPRKA